METSQYLLKPLNEKGRALLSLCKKKRLVLATGTRLSTKCVSPDTLICTEDGIVSIGGLAKCAEGESVSISKKVLSFNPKTNQITKSDAIEFYSSGFRTALKIKTVLGYELICSQEHPIWSEFNGEMKFRTSTEIKEILMAGGKVWLPLSKNDQYPEVEKFKSVEIEWLNRNDHYKVRAMQRIQKAIDGGAKSISQIMKSAKSALPTVRAYLNNPNHTIHSRQSILIDDDMAYFIGLLVGDGCYTKKVLEAAAIGFSSNDQFLIDFVKKISESRFKNTTFSHRTGCDWVIKSAPLKALLKISGMAGNYSHEKFVPDFVFGSPKSVVRAFLQGLFDTDGTVCKNGQPRYCSTSERLAKQVQDLLLYLGVRSSRVFSRNNFKGAWILSVLMEDEFASKVGFRLERKQLKLFTQKKFSMSRPAFAPSLLKVLEQLKDNRKSRGVPKLPRIVHLRTIGGLLRQNLALSHKRIMPFMQAIRCETEPSFQAHWIGGNVFWNQIESCEKTESELVDIYVPETNCFIGNGFINHNTMGCLHVLCDHAWNTMLGNIVLITISQSAGINSGVWEQLTQMVIPAFGLKYAKDPYNQGASKKPCCEVWNRHGGKTKIMLESLKDEKEVEERFKNKSYSMIFVTELDIFKFQKTFLTWAAALRMPHLGLNEHLLLADCNPADEGTAHWIYKMWYELRIDPDCRPELRAIRDQLGLLEFNLDDNNYSTKEEIELIKSQYADSTDLYDRYIKGLWVTASENALFRSVFKEQIHIIGDVATRTNPSPSILIPEPECFELYGGWDMGVVNSAFVVIEKVVRNVGGRSVPFFKILDELVLVDQDFLMSAYVEAVMEKMKFWEDFIGKPVQWTHWSDRSAFDFHDKLAGRYDHQEVADVSGGKIQLMAAMDGRRTNETVRQRIDLFRKLLFQTRVFFSAEKTPMSIEMCKSLKKGRGQFSTIQKDSKHKHVFDAITYAIATECSEELNRNVIGQLHPQTSESGLVRVEL